MPRAKSVVQKFLLACVLLGLLSITWRAVSRGKKSQSFHGGRGMETRSSSPASYMRSVKVVAGQEKENDVYRGEKEDVQENALREECGAANQLRGVKPLLL